MRKNLSPSIGSQRIFLLVSCLLLILIISIYSDMYAQVNEKNLELKLDEAIDSFYVNDSLPGIIAGIWTQNFIYKKTVGKADLSTGVDRQFDDIIRIGSITKTFVTTVILQLVDEGKLNIDDPLSKYYPDYPNSANITLRQIMDMTSGIPDYINDPAILQSFVYDRLDKYTPLELYEVTKKMTPAFEPGKGWQYSNGNYNILGMLIEKVTGNKMEDEINARIIKPLNLVNTGFPATPYLTGQYSHGYMRSETTHVLEDVTIMDPSISWAAGAMISNINDLKIYAEALAKGTLISKSSQGERLKFVDTGVQDFLKYGLGIFNFSGFIGHNGGITGYNTTMCYNPELDALIIVSVNEYGAEGGKSDAVFGKLASLVYPDENFFHQNK